MHSDRIIIAGALSAIVALANAAPTLAQDAAPPAPDASAALAEAALCTDRPTKANAACTVPAGDIQFEADAFNATFYRGSGSSTDVYLFTNPTLKYGLSSRSDIELNIVPYEQIRTKDSATGDTSTHDGIGDLYVRFKYNLTTTSTAAVTVLPFVKAPTASHQIGNRKWEGGVALPVAFALPDKFTLVLGPEVDVLGDADGSGRHANLVNVVNLSRPVTPNLTLVGELWSDINFDPQGTIHQYSADVGAAYGIGHNTQLDAGANFGLNSQTPDAQVYVGVSKRF